METVENFAYRALDIAPHRQNERDKMTRVLQYVP